jgi:predicted LPLAT superfamily acyltransferase
MSTEMAVQRRSPNYGGRFGYGSFHFLLRWFGVLPAYGLLLVILPYYVLFRPSARRAASYYLNHRFPNQRGFLRRLFLVYRSFLNLGLTLIDQGAMGILGPDRLKVDFPDQAKLLETARRGKGIVLLTTHAGNWQAAMATMGCLELPIHFQFQLEDHMEGRYFFDLAKQRGRFHIVPPSGFLGGVVEFTHALNAGECVAMMGDRLSGGRPGKALFLKEVAYFPAIPYQLALRTGADIVVLLVARTGRMSCRIEYTCITDGLDPGSLPREEAIQRLMERYARCLEAYLRKYPFMWFNFLDTWNPNHGT